MGSREAPAAGVPTDTRGPVGGGAARAGPGGAGVGQGRRGELGCGRASLPLFLQLPLPLRASVTRGAREERSCYFSPFP